jgi:hypothetical protein
LDQPVQLELQVQQDQTELMEQLVLPGLQVPQELQDRLELA